MPRIPLPLSALSALLLILPLADAQEAPVPASPSAPSELSELRQAVQQQSRQIESLTEQVGRLIRVIEGQKAAEFTPRSAPMESPKVSVETAADAPKAEAIPKAESAAGTPRHIVVKGETLTSIAKQYSIPIAELKNANKIEDERKLQIGQVLIVPTSKTPDSAEKKENL